MAGFVNSIAGYGLAVTGDTKKQVQGGLHGDCCAKNGGFS